MAGAPCLGRIRSRLLFNRKRIFSGNDGGAPHLVHNMPTCSLNVGRGLSTLPPWRRQLSRRARSSSIRGACARPRFMNFGSGARRPMPLFAAVRRRCFVVQPSLDPQPRPIAARRPAPADLRALALSSRRASIEQAPAVIGCESHSAALSYLMGAAAWTVLAGARAPRRICSRSMTARRGRRRRAQMSTGLDDGLPPGACFPRPPARPPHDDPAGPDDDPTPPVDDAP